MTGTTGRVVAPGDGMFGVDTGPLRERAAWGDREALRELDGVVRPFVLRMCRAELGAAVGICEADQVAAQLVPIVIAAVLGDPGTVAVRVAYTESVLGIERARRPAETVVPAGPFGGLPRHERDVLVLRMAVGLTVEQTAAALAGTVGEVLLDQHRAVAAVRRAAVGR